MKLGSIRILLRALKSIPLQKWFEEILVGEDFAQDTKIFMYFVDKKQIQVIQKSRIPEEIRHEISITGYLKEWE